MNAWPPSVLGLRSAGHRLLSAARTAGAVSGLSPEMASAHSRGSCPAAGGSAGALAPVSAGRASPAGERRLEAGGRRAPLGRSLVSATDGPRGRRPMAALLGERRELWVSRSDTRQSAGEELPQSHGQQALGRKERPGTCKPLVGCAPQSSVSDPGRTCRRAQTEEPVPSEQRGRAGAEAGHWCPRGRRPGAWRQPRGVNLFSDCGGLTPRYKQGLRSRLLYTRLAFQWRRWCRRGQGAPLASDSQAGPRRGASSR